MHYHVGFFQGAVEGQPAFFDELGQRLGDPAPRDDRVANVELLNLRNGRHRHHVGIVESVPGRDLQTAMTFEPDNAMLRERFAEVRKKLGYKNPR